MADKERDEIAARQAKPTPTNPNGTTDIPAERDQAHYVRGLIDASRHPVTKVYIP
jgi:hypothetical protein